MKLAVLLKTSLTCLSYNGRLSLRAALNSVCQVLSDHPASARSKRIMEVHRMCVFYSLRYSRTYVVDDTSVLSPLKSPTTLTAGPKPEVGPVTTADITKYFQWLQFPSALQTQ